ncbi:MAG: alkaline phosphatase family protein, partial [bacterium]
EMTLDLMKKDDWSLFAAVFQGTDHGSHMFWRFLDPEHPSYDEQALQKYGDTILSVYQRADKMVGQVLDDVMKDGDSLIVMSDHGFNTWRKSVNLNKWLVDQGYLAEKQSVLSNIMGGDQKSSVYKLFSKGTEFFEWVDWSKSKAYALGLGQVYINLEGREKEGIVTENERSALIDELIEKLKGLRDPETGEVVLSAVYRADKIYKGDNMEYAPDIVIGCAPGYRVSWQTTLGVAAEDLIEINHKKWSGDHCSLDRESIPGVLFSTEPITVTDPELIDLTPSILSLFGIPKPERCDGRVIF